MKKIKIKIPVISLSKRQIFVAVTLFLTFGLIGTQLIPVQLRYFSVLILGFMAYFLTAFSLREDLKKHEWLTLLVLPTFYTLSISYFYFLLPVRWITRLPMAFIFAFGYYALLLTENIFNISSARSIQLLRAAQAVGFYITLITYFLLTDLLLSLRLNFFANVLLGFIIYFMLLVQYLWSVVLTPKIEKRIWTYSLIIALCMAEFTLALSFWPVRTLTGALLLSSVFYAFMGTMGYELQEKLTMRVIYEFISLPVIVLILSLITTSWTL